MQTKTEISTANALSLALYKKLYMVRQAEKMIIRHYAEDEMKTPMHMSMGQEAVVVGVCHALAKEDQIWTSYRTHAAFLAKTQDTDKFFGELYGKVTGTAEGKGGSMHLSDPAKGHIGASAVVASGIPVTLGLAFTNKQARNGLISCVFFGDGAMDEGNFWESLNAACVMRLPVLFVCEDNGFAVHTLPKVRQGYTSMMQVLSSFDVTALSADTTDVESHDSLFCQCGFLWDQEHSGQAAPSCWIVRDILVVCLMSLQQHELSRLHVAIKL